MNRKGILKVNKQELINKLKNSRISLSFYHFDKFTGNEGLYLINENDKWLIFYSERGVNRNLVEFNTENEACEYFYEKAISETGNRIHIQDFLLQQGFKQDFEYVAYYHLENKSIMFYQWLIDNPDEATKAAFIKHEIPTIYSYPMEEEIKNKIIKKYFDKI